MKIDDLTLGNLKEILALANTQKTNEVTAYILGESYLIRTVTYHWVGTIEAIFPTEIVLKDASWVADTGRFHVALESGFDGNSEIEFAGKAIVHRGAIIDACSWKHSLPVNTK